MKSLLLPLAAVAVCAVGLLYAFFDWLHAGQAAQRAYENCLRLGGTEFVCQQIGQYEHDHYRRF